MNTPRILDLTLAPSWAFCTDIGRQHAGAVSGTMNMAGNLGSFVTTLAFPYLLEWTGSPAAFFHMGTGAPCESEGREYQRTVALVEDCYRLAPQPRTTSL